MTLRIYGIAKSRAFRNIWAATELGLRYEHVPIDFSGGPTSTKSAEFLAINPMGQVPVIDDDGFVMTESIAINLYLAKKRGGPLYPAGAQDEARISQWSFWAVSSLEAALVTLARNRVMLPPEKRSEATAAAAEQQLQAPLKVLDDAVAKTGWLVGDACTIADINVAGILFGAYTLKALKLDAFPNATAWLERCLARPAAQEARKLREQG
jgi:glutathione S-transferase